MANVEEAAVAYRARNPLKKVYPEKGKSKVIPVYLWSSYQKIDAIKEGISKEELENLKEQTGLDYDTLAKVLSVAKATLHNKKGKDKFDLSVSERLLLLADIYSYGYQVFESKERFNLWMKTSNTSLGGINPLSMLDTLYGMEEVKHLVGRIEYGVYS
ncbi:MAG: antitoxin Xre/MbcA/ParS toxin-binding domain-containing protein [Chitinophagaceae bacterium]